MADYFWKKRLFSKTFLASILTIARGMPKNKRKNPDKMCHLILKICPQQKRNNYGKILYILTENVKPYMQLHI